MRARECAAKRYLRPGILPDALSFFAFPQRARASLQHEASHCPLTQLVPSPQALLRRSSTLGPDPARERCNPSTLGPDPARERCNSSTLGPDPARERCNQGTGVREVLRSVASAGTQTAYCAIPSRCASSQNGLAATPAGPFLSVGGCVRGRCTLTGDHGVSTVSYQAGEVSHVIRASKVVRS
jgi:hypothetical protein